MEYFSNSADTESFDYDELGNRLTSTSRGGTLPQNYSVNDANNQYNSIDGTALAYDAAGNLIEDNRGYSYKWDHENHLIAVYKNNGVTQVVEYVYDALGRRVRKVLYNNGNPGLKYDYNYNGWQLLTEVIGAGLINLERDYAYGNHLYEVVLQHQRNNNGSLYFVHDHLNSPAAIISDYNNGSYWSAGDIVERYEFDAYGKRHSFNADYTPKTETNYTNVGFTGQRYDLLDYNAPTSTYGLTLNYYKNRWYSPDMGRFLSNDPLGVVPEGYMNGFSPVGQYKDGVNIYQYVGSSPVFLVDIYGLVEGDPTSPYNLGDYNARTRKDKDLAKLDKICEQHACPCAGCMSVSQCKREARKLLDSYRRGVKDYVKSRKDEYIKCDEYADSVDDLHLTTNTSCWKTKRGLWQLNVWGDKYAHTYAGLFHACNDSDCSDANLDPWNLGNYFGKGPAVKSGSCKGKVNVLGVSSDRDWVYDTD